MSIDLAVRGMAFRKIAVTELREVLRAWLAGAGLRKVAEQAGVDRKTARRYVQAAEEAGLVRNGGAGQLTDELTGLPGRPRRGGHGQVWELLRGPTGRDRDAGEGRPVGSQDQRTAATLWCRGAVPDAAPVLRGAVRIRQDGIHGAGRWRRARC
jgi:hypothetical protein